MSQTHEEMVELGIAAPATMPEVPVYNPAGDAGEPTLQETLQNDPYFMTVIQQAETDLVDAIRKNPLDPLAPLLVQAGKFLQGVHYKLMARTVGANRAMVVMATDFDALGVPKSKFAPAVPARPIVPSSRG